MPGRQQQPASEVPKAIPPAVVPKPLINKQVGPENGEAIAFVLNNIRLMGGGTISTEELSKLWAPYRGKKINIRQLYDIANQITKYYADAGYVLSFAFVPEQEIIDNIPVIRVVEGYVTHITFKEGDKTIEPPQVIQDLAREIQRSIPLKNTDLERYMLLINDQPGYQAQAVFVPSIIENTSDLIINLTHKETSGAVGIDNHLAKTLGRWHGRAAVTANGLVNGTDVLQIEQSCGQWCNVYSQYGIQWGAALNSDGTRINLGLSQSTQSPVEGVLVPLDFHGRSQNFNIDLSHPLVRSRQTNTDIGATLGWTDAYTKTFAGPLTQDSVRTMSAYGRYDYADKTGGVDQVRVTVTKGIPLFDATDDSDPLRSRSGGSSDFLIAGVSASRYQPLDRFMPALQDYSFMANINVQQTLTDPLLSVSQCYYGGDSFGRGYESGVLSGDSCAMGSLEFRRNVRMDSDKLVQLYAFGDGGAVKRKGALAIGEKKSESATSVGVGARLLIGTHIQGEFQVGWPLNEEVTSTGKTAPRSLLSLSVQF